MKIISGIVEIDMGKGRILKFLIVETKRSTHIIGFDKNNKIDSWKRYKYMGWWIIDET